jgi:hypothetical protein
MFWFLTLYFMLYYSVFKEQLVLRVNLSKLNKNVNIGRFHIISLERR